MTFATLGWGTWWVLLFVHKLVPERELGLFVPSVVSTTFAVLGLGLALLTVRARRSWILFVLVPVFANAGLLFVPWLATELAQGDP